MARVERINNQTKQLAVASVATHPPLPPCTGHNWLA